MFLHAGLPFAKKGGSDLALPKMGMPVGLVHWEVFLPAKFKVADFGGNAIPQSLVIGGWDAAAGEGAEALNEFKKGYLSVLFDIATESKSFDEYKAALNQFFCEVNPANEDAWKGALQEVRQGRLALSGFGSAKAESWMPKIDVQNVGHHATPTVNAFDSVAEAA